jgi:methyltransferase (TIGR00027 family)
MFHRVRSAACLQQLGRGTNSKTMLPRSSVVTQVLPMRSPPRSARLAAAAFRVIQGSLFPIASVAYVPLVLKTIVASRRSGASTTLLASFYTRWMQHQLGVRRDDACADMMKVLPNVAQLAWRMVTAPTRWAHHITGYVPLVYRYPYLGEPPLQHQPAARTTFYDQALERYLGTVDQFVVLGAGLDTRVYALASKLRVRCFEVDTPASQALKVAALAQAGVDTRATTYVAADFAREDWFAKLVAAGFDPSLQTLFTWESVSMYLERAAVERTLRTISNTAPGTILAFDYFSAQLLASSSPLMRYAQLFLRLTGEPWKFGIDNRPPAHDRLSAFLESCGLSLADQRNFGHESATSGAPAGFATAVVSAGLTA